MSVSFRFYGGQGRNRTADASLFRAGFSHSYLTDSTHTYNRIKAEMGCFIAAIMQPLATEQNPRCAELVSICSENRTRNTSGDSDQQLR